MTTGLDARWERISDATDDWSPYALLAVPTILTVAAFPEPIADRAVTLGLAVAAAAWITLAYRAVPRPRVDRRWRMGVYFVGVLVLAAALMLRSPIFLVFGINGFFAAMLLRPWPLQFAGVFASSTIIHVLVTGFPWPTVELWVIYVTVIVVQTLVIGFSGRVGEKLAELSEQRRVTAARLAAAIEENAGLHEQLIAQAREAGVMDERQRMAAEIHDTLAQGLTGIITQLEAAQQAQDHPPERDRHLVNAAQLARESLSEARRSVAAWRPASLEGADLPQALEEVATAWSGMSGVSVDLNTSGDPLVLRPEVEVALLRAAQEALANVAKHARATRVALSLCYMGDVVTLDVRDDGIGFDARSDRAPTAGFGLSAMRHRIAQVAGTLVVESEPGEGTSVSVRVPALAAGAAGLS